MKNPISTYRVQFHKDFTFLDFERIIPYLDKLGIRTLYASPIFEAVPGSIHGYDSVNPLRINPEIGTDDQLESISQLLRNRGINWIQDIVPNHMAFHSNNAWLMDVLEKGQKSPYAPFFDIDWNNPEHDGRLMVPFLGASLPETLEKGDLTIKYSNDIVVINYQESAYPVHLRSYYTVLQAANEAIPAVFQNLCDQIDALQEVDTAKMYAVRSAALKTQLVHLLTNADLCTYWDACLKAVNTNDQLLAQIIDEQAYRLCFYEETNYTINYRRFFTVNSLICLNIQDTTVFNHVHKRIKTLLETGVFQGLRVDHIDGLYDPSRYLEQLRALGGDDTYIIVEKILKTDEDLPSYWPIQGATGYGFLSLVNNLFTRNDSEASFTRFYQSLLDEKVVVSDELDDKKAHILYDNMGGELTNLHEIFQSLNLPDELLANIPADSVKSGIGEFLIQCPVYRYYGNHMPLDDQESNSVAIILDRCKTSKPDLIPVFDLLKEALLIRPQTGDEAYNQRVLHFYQRCMQFTGPLMAKGVEDTLMYTYTRFIGHDEVGDSPEFFGLRSDDFHQKMVDRHAHWPLALNATSTHDTKRGEDIRSRLNVLTDWTDDWIAQVQEWQKLNRTGKWALNPNGENMPDPNDEYFIYQTLIGAYPMLDESTRSKSTQDQTEDDFPDRLKEYLQKALREAKRHTTHVNPNEAYEQATIDFAIGLLDQDKPFWKSFQSFHQQVADFGVINSLAQVVLKCTCPGLPDVFQGCELWDLSLVDPDNRRPVDFDLRQRWLDELETANPDITWSTLWQHRHDGRIKLWLIHTLLCELKQQPDLFAKGQYIPLRVDGTYNQHVLAFARHYEKTWYIIAVPLGLAELSRRQKIDSFTVDWKDTHISLPSEMPEQWENKLLKTSGTVGRKLAINDLFKRIPVAVLKLE